MQAIAGAKRDDGLGSGYCYGPGRILDFNSFPNKFYSRNKFYFLKLANHSKKIMKFFGEALIASGI